MLWQCSYLRKKEKEKKKECMDVICDHSKFQDNWDMIVLNFLNKMCDQCMTLACGFSC